MLRTIPTLDRRAALVLLAVVVLFALAIRVYLFRGYTGLDDGEYARFAHDLSEGRFLDPDYTGPAVFPLRVGVTVPAAVAFRLFGVGEWPMVIYPLVLSIAMVVLAYACAARLFGRWAGVIAAALAAVVPMEVQNATKLYPDMPAAFFAAAAAVMLLRTEQREDTSASALASGGAVAGVLLGLSWLCKETISFMAPFLALWALIGFRQWGVRTLPLWLGVAAGSSLVLLAEGFTYYTMTGDPLYRFTEVERNYRQWPNSFFTEGSTFGWNSDMSYAEALRDRLFVSGPSFIFLASAFAFIPLAGAVAVIYGAFTRNRVFLIPAIWFSTLVLMFNFASSSTTTYLPLPLYDRYLYPLVFPAIVLAAGMFAALSQPLAERVSAGQALRALPGAVCALLIMASAGFQTLYLLRHPPVWWLAEVRELRGSIDARTPLYADALSLRALEFFEAFPKARETSWTSFEQLDAEDEIPSGSLVLVNRAYIDWLDRNGGMWVTWPHPRLTERAGYRAHAFYETPPLEWRTVWKNDNAVLYSTGAATTSR